MLFTERRGYEVAVKTQYVRGRFQINVHICMLKCHEFRVDIFAQGEEQCMDIDFSPPMGSRKL